MKYGVNIASVYREIKNSGGANLHNSVFVIQKKRELDICLRQIIKFFVMRFKQIPYPACVSA